MLRYIFGVSSLLRLISLVKLLYLTKRFFTSFVFFASVALMAAFCLIAFNACKSRSHISAVSIGPNAAIDMDSYVAACEQNVGPFPKMMNCFDLENSRELTIWTEDEGVTKRIGHDLPWRSGIKCDNPSTGLYALQACIPHSRIATYKSGSVTWSLLCRHFSVRDANATTFDAVGMIGHNSKNGATCFFDTGSAVDGTAIPKPALGSDFWIEPVTMATRQQSKCVNCHTAYPFITTPHLLGVSPYQDNFKAALAEAEVFLPRNSLKAPYFVVRGEALDEISGKRGTWVPRALVKQTAGACVVCHRLGEGLNSLHSGFFYFDQNIQLAQGRDAVTKRMKVYPFSSLHDTLAANMQLAEGVKPFVAFDSQEKFEGSQFYASVLGIIKNCKTPFKKNCEFEKTPGAEGEVRSGPEELADTWPQGLNAKE